MGNSGIPPRLYPEILKKAADNWSTRRISDWLKADEGVTASHSAVARRIKKLRETRHEAIKDQVEEVLVKSATSDLDLYDANIKSLDGIAKKAEAEWDAATNASDPDEAIAKALKGGGASARRDAIYAREAVAKALKGKLEMTGVGQPDSPAASVGVVILPPIDPE